MSPKHATGIHGYIIVYSINSPETFENTKVIREKILDFTGTNWVPIVLVGNKCDLHNQRYLWPPPFPLLFRVRSDSGVVGVIGR